METKFKDIIISKDGNKVAINYINTKYYWLFGILLLVGLISLFTYYLTDKRANEILILLIVISPGWLVLFSSHFYFRLLFKKTVIHQETDGLLFVNGKKINADCIYFAYSEFAFCGNYFILIGKDKKYYTLLQQLDKKQSEDIANELAKIFNLKINKTLLTLNDISTFNQFLR